MPSDQNLFTTVADWPNGTWAQCLFGQEAYLGLVSTSCPKLSLQAVRRKEQNMLTMDLVGQCQ